MNLNFENRKKYDDNKIYINFWNRIFFSTSVNNLCSRYAIIILLDQIFAVTLMDDLVLMFCILLFFFY